MDLVVAADDRTGAFEVAGRLAERTRRPVPVVAWPSRSDEPVSVVDLGSRHLSPADARARAESLPGGAANAHKIDSALRGNWTDELIGRSEAAPVVLVPALPEFGRTCEDGVVLDHGRPVHEGAAGSDVRRRVTSSRPAELLRLAGAGVVTELHDAESRSAWWERPAGIGVADARSDDDVATVVDEWRSRSGVVLAGTAAAVGRIVGDEADPPSWEPIAGPVLVVCGSVHPAARAQLAFVERRGVPVAHLADAITARELVEHGVLVLATEIPVVDIDEPMAVAATAGLVRGVADLRAAVDLGALVVIGGDTVAALYRSTPASVHGTIGPGTAWATVGDDPLPVITRSGGYGSEAALDDLIRAVRSGPEQLR